MSGIAEAVTSVQVLCRLIKAGMDLTKHAEISAAIHDTQAKLLEVSTAALAGQEKHDALLQKIRELEAQNDDLKKKSLDRSRYQLYKFDTTGSLTYILKPEFKEEEPCHHLCCSCYESGRKTILQPFARYGAPMLRCHVCEKDIYTGHAPRVEGKRIVRNPGMDSRLL